MKRLRKNLVPMLVLEPLHHVELVKKSAAEITAEDKQLDDRINNMKYNLVELKKEEDNHPLVLEWRQKKKSFILNWAEALARKIEIGTWNRPKDWISTHISVEMRSLQFNEEEIRHVRWSLPKEFKRESLTRGGEISADYDETIQVAFKDIDCYSADELIRYVEKANGVIDIAKDRNKKLFQDLELTKQRAKDVAKEKFNVDINVESEDKKEVISTIKPEPNKCESYYAAVDVYNRLQGEVDPETGEKLDYNTLWLKLSKKLEEYPATPPGETTTEDDKTITRFIMGKLQSLESEGRMLKSFIDDKYAQNLWDWFKTLVDEESWGKHAAAVKCKIMPKGPTKKGRPLTRERVGDVKEKYWKYMKDFSESMEYYAWWAGLAKIWDDKYHNPYNADRRNREAPKLSETAFGSSSDEE